jgi:hypothetical protein
MWMYSQPLALLLNPLAFDLKFGIGLSMDAIMRAGYACAQPQMETNQELLGGKEQPLLSRKTCILEVLRRAGTGLARWRLDAPPAKQTGID